MLLPVGETAVAVETAASVFKTGVTITVVSMLIAELGTVTPAVEPSVVVVVVEPPSVAEAVTLPVVVEGAVAGVVGAGAPPPPPPPPPPVSQREPVVTVTSAALACAGRTTVEVVSPQVVPGSVIPVTVNLYL